MESSPAEAAAAGATTGQHWSSSSSSSSHRQHYSSSSSSHQVVTLGDVDAAPINTTATTNANATTTVVSSEWDRKLGKTRTIIKKSDPHRTVESYC